MEHHDDPANHGEFAISACCLPGKTADELARLAGLPHRKIGEATVRAVRSAGYDVVPDEPPEGHALIMLPRLPTDEDYKRISDLFDPPRPNPVVEEGEDG